MKQRFYKKPGAVDHAMTATKQVQRAIALLDDATSELTSSGYKGAARGVFAANERLRSWLMKVEDACGEEVQNNPAVRKRWHDQINAASGSIDGAQL